MVGSRRGRWKGRKRFALAARRNEMDGITGPGEGATSEKDSGVLTICAPNGGQSNPARAGERACSAHVSAPLLERNAFAFRLMAEDAQRGGALTLSQPASSLSSRGLRPRALRWPAVPLRSARLACAWRAAPPALPRCALQAWGVTHSHAATQELGLDRGERNTDTGSATQAPATPWAVEMFPAPPYAVILNGAENLGHHWAATFSVALPSAATQLANRYHGWQGRPTDAEGE